MGTRWPLALLLAVTLGLAACGGGSSGGGAAGTNSIGGSGKNAGAGGAHSGKPGSAAPTGGSSPRRAPRVTFVRNADRVCRRAHLKLVRLGHQLYALAAAASHKRLPLSTYFSRAAAITDATAGVAGTAIANLRGLARPADRRIEQYLALSASEARVLAAEADALRHRDRGRVQALDRRARSLVARSRRLARDIGFHSCGGT
jgi:hypothetical protein